MSESKVSPAVFVVLPAYNEEAGLKVLLPGWLDTLSSMGCAYHFVIVNDGSKDDTGKILETFAATTPATIITHQPNQGLGATLRDGLAVAARRAQADDVIVTMDADNTHPVQLFPAMLAMLQKEGLDIVIASRYRSGAEVVGLSWHRRLLSDGARWLFQGVFPISGVRDYTCGYRVYRAEVLKRAMDFWGDGFCDQAGFSCMPDVLLKLARCGARCGEVGMVLRYDQKATPSAMKVGQTVWRTLRLLVHHRLAGPLDKSGPRS